ncbi:DNA-binding MarR family transcriptional regulator [Agromyces terreus]|uniref:DNA-binding MarR family transcriptional regulator n=1 Tax=Agromyces terreus TaxID=424795 RepID=A0A9X2GZ48_9MICO|nr:MarR family transcriptional regulator [Agromyces terreus]MCP2370111.1 DNA-binding MarR family transcriptional regulator [Agromyces terreus]
MPRTEPTATAAAPGRPAASARTAASARRPRTIADQSTELRLAIMRLSRRIRQERSDAELTASQFAALAWLTSEGPMGLGRLAECEGVSAPSMNRTTNQLVEAGLVVRAGAPEDGRKVLLECTPAGTAIVLETRRRRDAWLARRVATLNADERATLAAATELLKRITA